MTGVELKPSTAKAEVFWFSGSPNPVHAVSNSFEQARIDQPGNRPPTHASLRRLAQGEKAPLALS
jgi:hypothetical protein